MQTDFESWEYSPQKMLDPGKIPSNIKEIWKDLNERTEEKTLDSSYLSQMLNQQCARREELLIKKRELEDVTQAGIREKMLVCKENVASLLVQFTALKTKINKFKKEKLPSRISNSQFYENILHIAELEKAASYITVCDFIKTTSEQMEANLETGLDTEAVDLFCKLHDLMINNLTDTECSHLKNYYSSTLSHWEAQLKLKLTHDFEELLLAFGWPMNLKTAMPTLETRDKFRRTIRDLIRLSLTRGIVEKNELAQQSKPMILMDFSEGLIPVKIMAEPLRKRFGFHFFSPKATCDASRPEWYFSQVRTWLRELLPFVRTHLEPLSTESHISSVVDFVLSLTEMVVLKADSHLKSPFEVMTFSKILEEAIAYENEVAELVGQDVSNKRLYIPPIVSTLFSQPQILQTWITIERLACMEKLDEMFKSPSAWNISMIPGPAEIVDLFIAVGRFLINRFAHLTQPGHRILFIELLLELLDQFRIRCHQVWKAQHSSNQSPLANTMDCKIADTLGYVQQSIETWENLPFFTHLSIFMASMKDTEHKMKKLELQDTENGFANVDKEIADFNASTSLSSRRLFSDINELYECLGEEILKNWAFNIVRHLQAEIRNGYATVMWHVYEGNSGSLTPEFMKVISILQSVKTKVYNELETSLAEKWLKRVLILFDEMVMEEILKNKRFSPDAIKQITNDFDAVFTMLLGSSIGTFVFFRSMGCAIKVWNFSIGQAMLLYDTLTHSGCSFDTQVSTLEELELTLSVPEVIKLLKSRRDLSLA